MSEEACREDSGRGPGKVQGGRQQIFTSKQPQQQSKELNVTNISVDSNCDDERGQTAEAYRLHIGLSHG